MIAPFVAPQWVPHPAANPDRARQLGRDLGVPLPAAQVLVNRGVLDSSAAARFLDPSVDDLHAPHLLLGIDDAVERIRRAIVFAEPTLIYGDYDVDGITSTFLLH